MFVIKINKKIKLKFEENKMKTGSLALSLGCLGVAASLCLTNGCKSAEDYRLERTEYAVKHFELSKYNEYLEGEKVSLIDCVKIALEHNLDLKVLSLEQEVAKEQRTAELLGMLPELNISDSYTGRSNTAASSSEKIDSDGLTYGYSTSQDKTVNYLNVDLALSLVDFGLAFFNTQQSHDRVLIREQQTVRAGQNLTLEVVEAYFRVAAAQKAINITTKLLEDCRSRYELIEQLSKKREITPFRAFDETRRFVNMEKRLTSYINNYENSCVELRSLMGMHPAGKILVQDSILDVVPDFNLPEIELMEQIALMQRPELYEIDMNKHINVLECRKTLVMMFPNVRVYADFTNSSNSFLYNMSWYELGIRAAYNLLKLPQQIALYRSYSDKVDAEEARSFAQAIGVMAQVRMGHGNLMAVKERYELDNRVFNTYNKNLEWAVANRKVTGELSALELDHMRLSTAETQIDRLTSLGNYYIAYYKMLNTLGVRHLDDVTVDSFKAELEAAQVRAAEELDKARAEFDSGRVERLAQNQAELGKIEQNMVKQPFSKFGDVDYISLYDAKPADVNKVLTNSK